MLLKVPKSSEKYFWTQHSIYKLRQYGLSSQRVIRVIKNPQRKEEGIVPRTVAVMQPASTRNKNGKKTWSQEIWAMYQIRSAGNPKSKIQNYKIAPNYKSENYKLKKINKQQVKIISTWRYPGISPKRDPIPEEILNEINELSNL